MKDKIEEAYIQYVLEHGAKPSSVFVFAKKLKMKEAEFYQHYSGFESIEADFLHRLMDKTIEHLKNDSVFQEYGSKEKVLAFQYALTENLTANRSFVKAILPVWKPGQWKEPIALSGVKAAFKVFAQGVIEEGIDRGEIQDRPILKAKYADILWMQCAFLVQFWLKDHSKGFEQTDAAIEKTVQFSLDLMAKSPIDSAIDWVKFIWQNHQAA